MVSSRGQVLAEGAAGRLGLEVAPGAVAQPAVVLAAEAARAGK